MKTKMYVFALIFALYAGMLPAQTIYSNGTGGGVWSSSETWLGGIVPNENSDVIIASGDSVWTTVGSVCNNLTVYSGGKIATSVDTVYVAQTLTLEADAWFYNATTEPKLPGEEYILDPQSFVVHIGAGSVGGEGNLEFGNLIIQMSKGAVAGGNLLIHGDLIINNVAGQMFRGARPTSGNVVHTVEGNLYILKGIFSGIDVGVTDQTCVWNINGNVYVIDDGDQNYQESRIGLFSSANAVGYSEINIGGDLIIQGGRLQGGTSSSAGSGSGVFNISGNFSLDVNSNVATNTLGSVTINFNGTSMQYVNLERRFQMSTAVYTNINRGADVVFDLDTTKWNCNGGGEFNVKGTLELMGNSFIDGTFSFNLNPEAKLKIGSPDGITTGTTGNIRVDGTRSFSEEASYEYKSSLLQLTGDALPVKVADLIVNNPEGVTLEKNLIVNKSVNVQNGDLNLNGYVVTLAPGAVLTETPGNTVTGESGNIQTAIELNAPSGTNASGIGAMITSGANLGNTTIERHHFIPSGGGKQGIRRVYKIVPANNTGLNATLRLYYDESELNNIPEENLKMFQSTDGSDNPWTNFAGMVNTSENYVEKSGIQDLSFWTLADVNNPLPVEKEENAIPEEFGLYQNYPNPFNPSTSIKFDLPVDATVELSIYNMLGEKISTILKKYMSAGRHNMIYEPLGLSNGVYLYMIKMNNNVITKKMVLLK